MSNPSTAGVRRPSTVFQQGGMQWVPVPVGLDGPALDVWMAIMRITRAGTTCTAPDHALAGMIGRCCRYVQQGLKALEAAGMIERLRRRGGRIITVVARLAGRNVRTLTDIDGDSTDSQGRSYTVPHQATPPIGVATPPPSSEGIQAGEIGRPAVPADGPAGPEDGDPSPWTIRWFGGLIPALTPENSSRCGATACEKNAPSVT